MVTSWWSKSEQQQLLACVEMKSSEKLSSYDIVKPDDVRKVEWHRSGIEKQFILIRKKSFFLCPRDETKNG